ncbi:zinc ribbon domain-containing protein [Dictyobacter alpinus]|uniref:Zinc ribbon domain-containing protein n=1 Tax=Dictyobacter alpinus TaxID=2014873 RepID=A0A402BJF0_9CHLR|nr:zinc ribbon domain-containing protein [Dictyobacter alpinus]GCE31478.1 zinc ribbon domain-containing protein [Dictyobacter alpinus]
MSSKEQLCPQCGTQIQPGQKFCGHCGMPSVQAAPTNRMKAVVQPVAASEFVPRPDVPMSTSTHEETWQQPQDGVKSADHPIPMTPMLQERPAGNHPFQSAPQAMPYPPMGQMQNTPRPYPSMGQGQNMPQAYPPMGPAQNGAQPYMAPQYYGQPMPPIGYPAAPKKKHSMLFILLGVGIAMLVILCASLVFIVNTLSNQGSQQATTPNSDGQVQATPTVQPAGKPVLIDNFADNGNKWDLFQSDGYSANIQNHQLIMTEANGKNFVEHIPNAEQISDFQMDMTYTNLQAGQQSFAGIVFRRQNVPASMGLRSYELKFAATTGQYMIKKVVDPPKNHDPNQTNATITLASGFLDTPPPANQPIKISMIVKGTNMTFLVNGVQVATCDDNTSTNPYTTGGINLILQNSSSGTPAKVAFSHIALYSSESSPAAGPGI